MISFWSKIQKLLNIGYFLELIPKNLRITDCIQGQSAVFFGVIYVIDKMLIKIDLKGSEIGENFLYLQPIMT